MRVTGVVVIPAGTPAFERAVLRVSLLDVTLADAPAITKAEHTAEIARGGTDEQRLPFRFDAPDVGGTLTVAAHVDLRGDGRVHAGDLVSTTAVPPSSDTVVPVERA